ncbi:MAG: SAM-dependent methyltransferase [Myxococcales bacterium]|nr:SAM-dependent methyltransferase [Myxococcales bacterium]
MIFTMNPVAYVRGSRLVPEDDFWGGSVAEIELVAGFDDEALQGLDRFSHAEIVYVFDRVPPEKIVTSARHPRNNPDWPKVGIFAQRGKGRPNRIGTSLVPILRVAGRTLWVRELDAIDGTPVLDIKPVLREFLPRGEVYQPRWATEIMENYWLLPTPPSE